IPRAPMVLSWQAFFERRNRLAHGHLRLGLKRGDHAIVYAPNSVDRARWRPGRVAPTPKLDGDVLEELKKLLDRIEDSPGAQREFVEHLRSLLPRPRDPLDDASDRFFSRPGDELLKDLASPLRPRLTPAGDQGRGAAMGSATPTDVTSGLGDVF